MEHHVNASTVGHLADPLGECAVFVHQHVIGATRLRDRRFFGRTGGGEHFGAAPSGELHEQLADAARSRVHEIGAARAELRDVLDQLVSGGSLKNRGSGDVVSDRFRQFRETRGRHDRIVRIRAARMHHATRSPARNDVTPSPTAATSPAPSKPSVHGTRTG